jgi:hypothetical protein
MLKFDLLTTAVQLVLGQLNDERSEGSTSPTVNRHNTTGCWRRKNHAVRFAIFKEWLPTLDLIAYGDVHSRFHERKVIIHDRDATHLTTIF